MTDRQDRADGRGTGRPARQVRTSPAALLRRSLAYLYDALNGSSATDRTDPRLSRRTDRQVWERLRTEIAAQMEKDRERGRSTAPDRTPVFMEQTFRTLRRDLDAGRPLSRDRLRVLEAVLALGRPGHRLPRTWIDRAPAILAADPPPARRPGDGGKRHHDYVEDASAAALEQVRGIGGPDGVSLSDVYVVRGQEEALARLLEQQAAVGVPGQPVQVVLGEAGTGKTSMLWFLATALRGRKAAAEPSGERTGPPSSERRRGAVIKPCFFRGEDLLDPRGGERLLEALGGDLSQAQVRRGRVVLLDSADLLLHAEDGRGRLRQVVELCRSRGVPMALTCRTRDRSQLEDVLGAAPLAVSTHVEDFRFDGEVERAVTTYCRHYLSADIQRSTASALLRAAVRGLPVREVVARPLTLRMLLQVYVEGMDTDEMDAGLVYDEYWRRRVAQDLRQEELVPADTRDLSWPAQATARLMLHDGVVALPAVELTERLPMADAGPGGGDPGEHVAVLENRAVLTRTTSTGAVRAGEPGGSVQFFHQTLYEYAAGRCVARLVDDAGLSYYRALEAHLTDHPDDFLRAAVAEQAIVQGVRSRGTARTEATGLFLRLLRSTEVDLQVIAVRCYAFLPHLYAHERKRVQAYLRDEAPQAMAEELLAILPTRRHPRPEVVTADLADVLRRHPRLRRRVLELLSRFSGVDEEASGAVWSLLHELCDDHQGCLTRPARADDPPPAGCGGELCLWSWLVRLDGNSATSHGNPAARLVSVLAVHHDAWALARIRELLALAQHHRARAQVLQCVPLIHGRRLLPGWSTLMRTAAETAARLGPGRRGGARPPADEADTASAQEILDAYWYEAAATDRAPLDVLRALAREGDTPFDAPPPRLRGVLTRLGEGLRAADPDEVRGLLDEAVALCGGSDRVDQVARALLPPLLTDPAPSGPGAGTRAAEGWCADRLADFAATARTRPPGTAVRFAVAGLSRLGPGHAARLMPWSPAARPSGRAGGSPWRDARADAVWLAPNSATRLLVPLAAAGDRQATAGLERWRSLERARHDQLVRGRNDWPRYHEDAPWHGPARGDVLKLVHTALADLAALDHTLIAEAVRHKVPPADLPWLAKLAKAAADQPGDPSATLARAVLTRYGPDLAGWCSDLWDRTLPCPDNDAKTAALRLWGDLVRLGAAERPGLRRQAELARTLGGKAWAGATVVFRYWNRPEATAVIGSAGDPEWADLDAALAEAAEAFPGRAATLAPLRSYLHCRFAPLTDAEAVTTALAAARAEVRAARTTADIHDSGAGFLAERLCAVDPAAAVAVTVMVAGRTARASSTEPDPHHVTRLGWMWQKPLSRLAASADPAQWRTLLTGLADGPLAVLQKALDLAASHRRDEDLRAVAESALAASPYRGEALAGLRDAAIRHRRTPLDGRRWTAILDPDSAESVTEERSVP
ncbi:NACHT domain-containing protein [Streptomyces sp. NPDC058052]|uniref:NACHT domain-containing protein n=1 Tax=Streptomyces sp. NPDC058052 TaxID=3346316 RepID=UPI0036E7D82D